jgi:tetratricopeptide (TPR) repeat protein
MILLLSTAAWCASEPATAHFGKGAQLMRLERYEDAAQQFEETLKEDPSFSSAKQSLAICRFQLRSYDTARLLFSQQKSIPKFRREAVYYLGRLDLMEGDLTSAIRRFRSVQAQPRVHDVPHYLGVAYFKNKQYAEAVQAFQQWITESPRDFRSYEWLGRSLFKLDQKDEAKKQFEEAKRLHEYYAEGSTEIGGCRSLLNMGKRDEAWDQCQEVLQSDDVDKLVAVGMLFGEAGDARHAGEAWAKAVALDPESPEIQYNLALASFHSRDMAASREHAAQAIELWPDFPEAHVLFGTVLYMLADDARAKAVLTRAHALLPDDPTVNRLLAELSQR